MAQSLLYIPNVNLVPGVLKTYKLSFESVSSVRALFDDELARNRWSISSRTLREFVEHFGPKTEQLDMYSEDGRATFTSYTEKIMSGNEVLKQPLHTSIAIDTLDFSEFSVEERLHVVISVKDFKAIVSHAGITSTTVSVAYSQPMKPMKLTYNDQGMVIEFILMTTGDFRGSSATPAPGARARSSSKRPAPRQQLEAVPLRNSTSSNSAMPPPPRSAAPSVAREPSRSRVPRPSPPPPQPSLESNSLFFPEDDDHRWDPVNYGDEDEEMLGWDANADNSGSMTLGRSLQDNGRQNHTTAEPAGDDDNQRLAPTQRISQIRGLFDD